MREDMKTVLPIIKKLADEFSDVYMPLDEIFAEALKTQPEPLYYSADGVHPTPKGNELIAKYLVEELNKIL